jgi:hypothetical protein
MSLLAYQAPRYAQIEAVIADGRTEGVALWRRLSSMWRERTFVRSGKSAAISRWEYARPLVFIAVEIVVGLLRRHLEGEGAGLMSWPPMAAFACAGWGFLVHARLTFRDLTPTGTRSLGLFAPFMAASFTAYVIEAVGLQVCGQSTAAVLGGGALGVGVKFALVRMLVWPPRAVTLAPGGEG